VTATIVTITPSTSAEQIDDDTTLVGDLTHMIRQAQTDIANAATQRREAITRLRAQGITYRRIAEHMGTTEQNVYKILRTPKANP